MEIHEVFTDLGRKNDGESRAKVLLDNDSLALRTLMRLNFDKTIKGHGWIGLRFQLKYNQNYQWFFLVFF